MFFGTRPMERSTSLSCKILQGCIEHDLQLFVFWFTLSSLGLCFYREVCMVFLRPSIAANRLGV